MRASSKQGPHLGRGLVFFVFFFNLCQTTQLDAGVQSLTPWCLHCICYFTGELPSPPSGDVVQSPLGSRGLPSHLQYSPGSCCPLSTPTPCHFGRVKGTRERVEMNELISGLLLYMQPAAPVVDLVYKYKVIIIRVCVYKAH